MKHFKMNLYYILITSTLVKVLADDTAIADYKKLVFFTNLQIEQALSKRGGLKTVIKRVVIGRATMKQIAMMLAVPESADTTNIAVCIADQVKLQREIICATSIPVPQVEPDLGDNWFTMLKMDFGDNLLPDLGTARRVMTKEITKSLVLAAILGYESAFRDFKRMCRLIGLFRSIKFPASYVLTAEVDNCGTCTLTGTDGSVSKYRFVDEVIWEVEVDKLTEVIQLLRSQVASW
ncbi:uncharacterized protein LOC126845981 isoform X2 [Adelges cooleyi]|uniref:uncharacterized protein LOC126835410 isoform X2 n=1 Tax=Adelges cooleyi TaxID=133065 RepID=UPI00217FFF61|nr:uncharacterized protein LOC126835410 isoform X2 [Adelges cooleyi]XP_050441025.1 uncharacterized protein LOC126845981 isoform X2 [Adelges cooleyi]